MMKKLQSSPKKSQLFLQGGIVVCIAAVAIMAISQTIAWFTSSTINHVDEVTIEVSSSRTFDLSLDGVNFGRDLKLKIYDEQTHENLNTLLDDVSPILTTDGSHNQSLKLYSPKKDEYTGAPITENSELWNEATKTTFKYDVNTNTYYVVNSESSTAEYIEFDLWVRSETELDIYLGSTSYIKPTFTESDATNQYAVYQIDEYYRSIDEKIYKLVETPKGKIVTDYLGNKYVYSTNDGGLNYTFIAMAQDNGIGGYLYYDLDGYQASAAQIAAAKIFTENTYSYTISEGEGSQDPKVVSKYYAPDGIDKKLVGIVETIEGVSVFYKTEEDYSNGTSSVYNKEFAIKSTSPYIYQNNTMYGDVVKVTEIDRFSKNLAAGAMRVALSEVDVDTGNNQNLKYVWNPQPNYKLTNTPSGAKVDIVNQNEDTYYYVTDGAGNYTIQSFQEDLPGFLHNGNILTTTDNPAVGEVPVCSLTTPSAGEAFCMKRLRVMVYLDGNDNEAQNPLLSSSSSGNGHVDINLQFVSQYDNVIVDDISQEGLTYTFAAYRSSEVEEGVVDYTDPKHTYTWTINNSDLATLTTSTKDMGDGKSMKIATVECKKPGVVILCATDETGRSSTYTIVTDTLNVTATVTGSQNVYSLATYKNGVLVSPGDVEYTCDSAIVSIEGNEVTFSSKGSAIVYAKTADGIGYVAILYN